MHVYTYTIHASNKTSSKWSLWNLSGDGIGRTLSIEVSRIKLVQNCWTEMLEAANPLGSTNDFKQSWTCKCQSNIWKDSKENLKYIWKKKDSNHHRYEDESINSNRIRPLSSSVRLTVWQPVVSPPHSISGRQRPNFLKPRRTFSLVASVVFAWVWF